MPGQERQDITAQGTPTGLLSGRPDYAKFITSALGTPYGAQAMSGLLSQMAPQGQGFTLSPGQTRFDPMGRAIASGGEKIPEGKEKDRFGFAKDLRKEHSALSGDFRKVSDAYGRVIASTENPSPAGDLSLIFNYMKMLDPGSVVRESEFRTAEQAKAWLGKMDSEGQPVPNQIRTIIQKATEGTFLLPEQRADFVNKSQALYGSQEAAQANLDQQYKELALRYGLKPENVLIDPRTKRGKSKPLSEMTDKELEAIARGR